MDPNLAYWTAAWLNMACVVVLGLAGLSRIRGGEVQAHRRRMLVGIALVGAFLLSYLLKLTFLGREALETWPVFFVHVLRFHELCVAVMLLGGGIAVYWARRLRLAEFESPPDKRGADLARGLRLHRIGGRAALVAACLGLASSALVLFGMYQRA